MDDDLFFDLDLVEQLMNTHLRFPGAIVGMRVHRMLFGEDGQPLPYEQWDKEYTDPERKPSMELLATTGAGTLFPPHIFPDEVRNAGAIFRGRGAWLRGSRKFTSGRTDLEEKRSKRKDSRGSPFSLRRRRAG